MPLLKPQKGKKKDLLDFDAQQLDLVKSLDNQKKAKKNRFWIILLLVLTTGLSLLFWSYNSLRQQNLFQNFNINLPRFSSQSPPSDPDFQSVISPFIQSHPDSWSIYIETLPGSTRQFSWSYLSDSLFNQAPASQLISQIQSQPISSDPSIRDSLPQGAQIKQIKQFTDTSRQYQILVSLPRWQIFMIIQISRPVDLDAATQQIPSLVKNIYWTTVSQY